MQRDFVGYGNRVPKVVWPHGAQIAVNFVLNYEEGAEHNILDGDTHSENYLTDLPGVLALDGERHLSAESMFEYGSRVGVWRLLHLFEEKEIPLTLFASGLALERNLPLAEHLKQSRHEIAGHGYRWINYREVATHLKMITIGLHARLSGRPGRSEILRQFIDFLHSFQKVWICRREEIAAHWSRHHPAAEGE